MSDPALEVCALCGRPIPVKWQATATLTPDGYAHPGCARKAEGKPAR